MIPMLFCLYLILDFGLDMNGSMAQAISRTDTHRQDKDMGLCSRHAHQPARGHWLPELLA